MDDLDWVRWRLDRLAAARLLGPLATELETDYQFLALVEHELVLERSGRSRPPTDGEGVRVFTLADGPADRRRWLFGNEATNQLDGARDGMQPSAPGGEKD